ncbi:hypothetical protein EC988_006319 [Linderina pennispora]|nr:hypothetical protein EC988_006319 [Linderina pennispora]
MSLFRNSTSDDCRSPDTTPLHYNNNSSPAAQNSAANGHLATYYDVMKCTGEFATPSEFFERTLKPVHSSSLTYPWASKPNGAASPKGARLRPSAVAGQSSVYGSEHSAGSSSVFTAQMRSALPSSVFQLPGHQVESKLGEFMSGGQSLRQAGQVRLSKFDRKVSLV